MSVEMIEAFCLIVSVAFIMELVALVELVTSCVLDFKSRSGRCVQTRSHAMDRQINYR